MCKLVYAVLHKLVYFDVQCSLASDERCCPTAAVAMYMLGFRDTTGRLWFGEDRGLLGIASSVRFVFGRFRVTNTEGEYMNEQESPPTVRLKQSANERLMRAGSVLSASQEECVLLEVSLSVFCHGMAYMHQLLLRFVSF